MKFAELIEANLDELAALESLDSESFSLVLDVVLKRKDQRADLGDAFSPSPSQTERPSLSPKPSMSLRLLLA